MAEPTDEEKKAAAAELAKLFAADDLGGAKKDAKTWLDTYSPTQLRYAFRAGLIDEGEWQQELIARGETPGSARAEIEKQKSVGVSTAASSRGQLTAAEQAGVDALKKTGAPTGRPQVLDSWESPSMAKAGMSTVNGRPFTEPASTGGGEVGPGGRTFAQVTGTDYVNDAERQWYLSQAKNGGGTSTAASGQGGTARASGASSSSGAAAKPGKPDDAGSTFTVRGKDGVTNHWLTYTRADGTRYYENLETGERADRLPSEAPVPAKKSPLQNAADALSGVNSTLSGAGAENVSTGMMSGKSGDVRDPQVMTADEGRRVTGLDMPGYGTLNTVGQQNNVTDILGAAHLKPSGDSEMDLRTALGILGKRNVALAGGMSPTEYQTSVDQLAYSRSHPNGGGMPNYNTGFVPQVGTPAVNAQGRIVIDDSPGNYRELLDPTQDPYAMANGSKGGFNTPNPIAFVDMVTGQPIGMAGGTGRETISVDPDGPHGTPAQEAQVGSRLWPEKLGVKPYANGIDDILKGFADDGVSTGTSSYGGADTTSPSYSGQDTVNYSSQNGGRDPDYVSNSMLNGPFPSGRGGGGSFGFDANFRPTMSPKEAYDMRVAQGWAQPEVLPRQTNDAFIRWLFQGHFNDPIAGLPADKLPSQFLEDSDMTRARDVARRPWWYGLNDSYQADGGTNTAGGGGNPYAQHWGAGMMDDLLGWHGALASGAFSGYGNAESGPTAAWGALTPAQQMGKWSGMTLPGMGTPMGGNHWLPRADFYGLSSPWYASYNYNSLPLASYFNTDAAPLSVDVSRELGSQINPNATRSLGLQAPQTQQQLLNTPVNVLKAQGAGANPMADGGMGMAGGQMMPPPQTDFSMLLETLLGASNKAGRKPPMRPVGATMMGAAA